MDPLRTQFRDRVQCPSRPVHQFTQGYYDSTSMMPGVFQLSSVSLFSIVDIVEAGSVYEAKQGSVIGGKG